MIQQVVHMAAASRPVSGEIFATDSNAQLHGSLPKLLSG
jgi:hypothetical protein